MSAPPATHGAPNAPNQSAQEQAPPPRMPEAPPALGTPQAVPAPAARRNRAPRGPIPTSTGPSSSGAPALLELAAAVPMHTQQRRAANFFVPDATHLFHVLSICDSMMGSTHRFLQSAPAWLPIVSQLYVSVLWNYHIMRIYAHTGYGLEFAGILRDLDDVLRLDECMVPGPLLPFFESLAAVNGPFDWIGDVTPALPNFDGYWNATDFIPNNDFLRISPVPVVMLDQLAHFAKWSIPAQQSLYGNFEWYRNIFCQTTTNTTLPKYRIGPQNSGSLFTTEPQVNAARSFWNPALASFTRVNASTSQPPLNNWGQMLGLLSQSGKAQVDWFQHVAIVMQKYCQYFNGSRSAKTISPVGLGSVLIRALPQGNAETRNWIYPSSLPQAFLSSRFNANHAIPAELLLDFSHADHNIEEVAEQYAILTSTNVQWASNNLAQHSWPQLQLANTHAGDYWLMMTHRQVLSLNLTAQFAQLIASRYHQTTAQKSE
uniref:Coat protein n=1 Tax=Entoleuca partitivirus 1 TaxID=2086649 RepID=A0A6M8AWF1_9VIRU|nr:coat protein [Entoleuca partitivirus 1]